MESKDAHLRDALVELANLRARDERMRRASEALAEALKTLVDERDWQRLPQLMVDHLARALETPAIAIRARDPETRAEATSAEATPAFIALLSQSKLMDYLAKKPQRTVTDVAALTSGLGLQACPQTPDALLSGRVLFDGHCWLVLCAGERRLAEPEAQTLFQRFLPVFAQALQRLLEGRRADEMERRERDMLLAKEKAEAASRAKSEFVSRMSHELRTPLNAIIGFAQLLKDEPLTHSQNNYVQLIASSGDHLLDLINTVLDHAKIEAGKLTLESIPFNLAELIAAVATMINQQASAKGLMFETVVANNLPARIVGDPTRLRQILLNLLANAVKFTEQGGVTLSMAADDGVLHFSVRDTGVGMDEAALSRLFQPFSQADESTSRKFGGTGLGLLIARDLLQAAGGDIEVDSAPNAGTCFWGHLPLRLPAAEDAHAQPTISASITAPLPTAENSATAAPLTGKRVLVVDDNVINCKLASALLHRMGIAVETAEDGRAGLARIDDGGFDLVLMDVEMPEMDGLSATRALRALEIARGTARLPVIALTANAMVEDRARCEAAGMDGYVAKPIVVAQLKAELERLLMDSR
jgi:signal transduction histidine kinase/ActR/RegA family two-component response regulator